MCRHRSLRLSRAGVFCNVIEARYVRTCMTAPTEQLAADIAADVTGHTPSGIRRFTTGTSHYVFEALFANRLPVVVRIGDQSARTEMEGAVYLSGLLRPQGVPLPEILAENAHGEVPWLVLQRLPGTDLGTVIANLTTAQLERIAISVSRAQTITARTAYTKFCQKPCPQRAPIPPR
ncbi:phosphotransferase [Rhizobium leguminosarum]|uniref:phosphotransferase n=1 Tax=Rhizobium leguminosarum TaxID=384 RepID=UPI0035E44BBE